MGGWCKEQYNKDENKLEGLHQKLDQMEETRWEGQNFSEVVVPRRRRRRRVGGGGGGGGGGEEEEEEVWNYHFWNVPRMLEEYDLAILKKSTWKFTTEGNIYHEIESFTFQNAESVSLVYIKINTGFNISLTQVMTKTVLMQLSDTTKTCFSPNHYSNTLHPT